MRSTRGFSTTQINCTGRRFLLSRRLQGAGDPSTVTSVQQGGAQSRPSEDWGKPPPLRGSHHAVGLNVITCDGLFLEGGEEQLRCPGEGLAGCQQAPGRVWAHCTKGVSTKHRLQGLKRLQGGKLGMRVLPVGRRVQGLGSPGQSRRMKRLGLGTGGDKPE